MSKNQLSFLSFFARHRHNYFGNYKTQEFRLTLLAAKVRVEALWLEHDEERSPSQQHSREEQILNDSSHCHPPAPGKCCGQGWSHGWLGKKVKDRSKKQEERDLGDKERKGERRCSWKCRKNLPDWRSDERSQLTYLWREKSKRRGGGLTVSLSLWQTDRKAHFFL